MTQQYAIRVQGLYAYIFDDVYMKWTSKNLSQRFDKQQALALVDAMGLPARMVKIRAKPGPWGVVKSEQVFPGRYCDQLLPGSFTDRNYAARYARSFASARVVRIVTKSPTKGEWIVRFVSRKGKKLFAADAEGRNFTHRQSGAHVFTDRAEARLAARNFCGKAVRFKRNDRLFRVKIGERYFVSYSESTLTMVLTDDAYLATKLTLTTARRIVAADPENRRIELVATKSLSLLDIFFQENAELIRRWGNK